MAVYCFVSSLKMEYRVRIATEFVLMKTKFCAMGL
jgi:hypothetical protein